MEFAVMVWKGTTAKDESIFGLIDRKDPKKLPKLSSSGHWEDYRVVDEGRCKFADEAKEAIAKEGYYLLGASITVKEAFGGP